MTDTITVTVNGRAVVFERIESEAVCMRYINGGMVLIEDYHWELWDAEVSGRYISLEAKSAEEAMRNLTSQAAAWLPVLRELARLGGEE